MGPFFTLGLVSENSIALFCYSHGNFNDKIARMVKEAGYSLAVTTKKGGGMMQGLIFSPSAELASIRI
jgi:hypothetical protein